MLSPTNICHSSPLTNPTPTVAPTVKAVHFKTFFMLHVMRTSKTICQTTKYFLYETVVCACAMKQIKKKSVFLPISRIISPKQNACHCIVDVYSFSLYLQSELLLKVLGKVRPKNAFQQKVASKTYI